MSCRGRVLGGRVGSPGPIGGDGGGFVASSIGTGGDETGAVHGIRVSHSGLEITCGGGSAAIEIGVSGLDEIAGHGGDGAGGENGGGLIGGDGGTRGDQVSWVWVGGGRIGGG